MEAVRSGSVIEGILAEHGFTQDFRREHRVFEKGDMQTGSDAVDTVVFSACADEARCVFVDATQTGDARYPEVCKKHYDAFYGQHAIGVGRYSLGVFVTSNVSEAEMKREEAVILDAIIDAVE